VIPRLVSCYFGDDRDGQWNRLARVLAHSAETHCSTWDRQISALPTPTRPSSPRVDDASLANTVKLRHWVDAVRAAGDGQLLALVDSDTVILRPLDDVWALDFDLAYTVRRSAIYPFNAGVVFLRVTARTRGFVEAWLAMNELMLVDRVYHQAWRSRFGGINQAALGAVFETPIGESLRLLQLPCLEWNCEDTSWSDFDAAVTRIVHVKTSLRRMVFCVEPTWHHRELVRIWRNLEAEALARAVA